MTLLGNEHVNRACGVFPEGNNRRVGLEGVLVEQDGEVCVASVRNELIGEVGDVITRFLKDNSLEPSTGRRNCIGVVCARRAWIPLKDRETVLVMHEIAVSCINVTKSVRFDLAKFDHGENQGPRLWKRSTSRTRVCTDGMVGSRQGGCLAGGS